MFILLSIEHATGFHFVPEIISERIALFGIEPVTYLHSGPEVERSGSSCSESNPSPVAFLSRGRTQRIIVFRIAFGSKMAKGKGSSSAGPLPLLSLNHISLLCMCIEDSISFYENVLGFIQVKRPGSFDFDGAWLFNYGIGIHLLQYSTPDDLPKKAEINPRDDHISFQCEDMQAAERKLQEMNVKYVKRTVEEGGIYVDQMFFHDPDGFMVEICNCENLPVEPLMTSAPACLRLPCSRPRVKDLQASIKAGSGIQGQMIAVGANPGQEGFAV